MSKKTILITGSTRGMGKATAVALAKQGHRVIIHGTKEVETQAVRQEIIIETGNSNIDYLVGDLSMMSETRLIANNFLRKHNQLDVLINNAGALMGKEREETTEGIEKTIALNLLAPYLLSSLLLKSLQASNDARIINVASSAHSTLAKPDFRDLESNHNYNPNRAYGNAKLFLIMISRVMDKQVHQQNLGNITVNTLHPAVVVNQGMVNTLTAMGFLGKLILPVMRLFTKTPEQGARSSIYLATSENVKSTSGLYFIDGKPAKVNEKFTTIENDLAIWDYCNRRTGVKFGE